MSSSAGYGFTFLSSFSGSTRDHIFVRGASFGSVSFVSFPFRHSPMPLIITDNPRAILTVGDPTLYRISAGGKLYTFEWHGYSGPVNLDKRGNEARQQPMAFLEAATLWNQQGRKIDDDGMCIWMVIPEPKEILRKINSRNYQVLGYEPAEPPYRGS